VLASGRTVRPRESVTTATVTSATAPAKGRLPQQGVRACRRSHLHREGRQPAGIAGVHEHRHAARAGRLRVGSAVASALVGCRPGSPAIPQTGHRTWLGLRATVGPQGGETASSPSPRTARSTGHSPSLTFSVSENRAARATVRVIVPVRSARSTIPATRLPGSSVARSTSTWTAVMAGGASLRSAAEGQLDVEQVDRRRRRPAPDNANARRHASSAMMRPSAVTHASSSRS
jgi:hypothetical protein